ncbi:MAG: DUF3000 family protein [Micrococcales bacterium]
MAAEHSLRMAFQRSELDIQQIPAPKEIAESSIAFAASVRTEKDHEHTAAGTGRFVLFWSPEPQENWTTRFRIVIYARSPLETDIGDQEDSAELTWAWLLDALKFSGSAHSALAGTTTRIISTGHGDLASEKQHAEIELRASWSPHGAEMGQHFEAWQNLICSMSDLNLAPGVEKLDRLV